MKSLIGSQGVGLPSGLLDRSPSWGSPAGYKKKDEMLDGETASGSVGWSL
jgi:hypothetical protein